MPEPLDACVSLQDFYRFMADDRELLRASKAKWVVVPAQTADQALAAARSVDKAASAAGHHGVGTHERAFLRIALPEEAVEVGDCPAVVGRHADCSIVVDSPMVSLPLLILYKQFPLHA